MTRQIAGECVITSMTTVFSTSAVDGRHGRLYKGALTPDTNPLDQQDAT
jgi:hypothetical protein